MPCSFLNSSATQLTMRSSQSSPPRWVSPLVDVHFDHAVADFQHADIEGAAAQVEDQDGLVVLLIQPVSQGGGGGLVDDAQHFQPGDLAGVLGGLALAVVEVGRDGDHRLGDRLAQVGFGVRS